MEDSESCACADSNTAIKQDALILGSMGLSCDDDVLNEAGRKTSFQQGDEKND